MALQDGILGLLHKGPMSGYEIKKFYRKTIKHFWSVSDGQLYPTLKKMHEAGLVDKKVVPQTSTADKHIYSITQKGEEYFNRWLRKPSVKFEELREPFVMKMFFFDMLNKDEVISHLESQYDLNLKVLREFQEAMKLYIEDLTNYQKLVVEVDTIYIQLRLLWLSKMLQLVREDKVDGKHGFIPEEFRDVAERLFSAIFSERPFDQLFKALVTLKEEAPTLFRP